MSEGEYEALRSALASTRMEGFLVTEQTEKDCIRLMNGEVSVEDVLYFYAPALSKGIWINANRTYYTTIGCHRFYL